MSREILEAFVHELANNLGCGLAELLSALQIGMEAFRSDTPVANYMRMRLMTKDWSQYQKQIKQIYNEAYERTKIRSTECYTYYDRNAQREHSLLNTAYYTILFLEEEHFIRN